MFCSGSLNRLDCHLLAQLAADDADDDAGQVSTNGTAAAAGPDRQLAPLAVGEPAAAAAAAETIIIMKGTTLRS